MRRFLLALQGLWKSSHKVQAGVIIIAFFILVALLNVPITALIGHGHDPLDIDVSISPAWQSPNAQHLLGTDRVGRDILAMTVIGLTASLEVGVIAGLISTVIGTIIAFVAGYKGGNIDNFLSSFTDMFLVVPSFPLLITLSAYATNVNLFTIALILAIFSWPFAARTIRSQVLSLRSRPYVELAKVTKFNDMEIIFTELMPNLLPFIGVGFANAALGSVFALVWIANIYMSIYAHLRLGIKAERKEIELKEEVLARRR